jgi:hypothetical protein
MLHRDGSKVIGLCNILLYIINMVAVRRAGLVVQHRLHNLCVAGLRLSFFSRCNHGHVNHSYCSGQLLSLHPWVVNISSTSFCWGYGGMIASIRWQITLFDPTDVISHSSEMFLNIWCFMLTLTLKITQWPKINYISHLLAAYMWANWFQFNDYTEVIL